MLARRVLNQVSAEDQIHPINSDKLTNKTLFVVYRPLCAATWLVSLHLPGAAPASTATTADLAALCPRHGPSVPPTPSPPPPALERMFSRPRTNLPTATLALPWRKRRKC
ncbi:hypothetical protein Naga_100095g16 [Nannochloropsis gaditana]|uniref:Uncharacterized protein n=1 Tax=Nannochloropsis gaditana TaxID=72520 RepID=W7TP18_9STRA|nr:hypothetical protein Naga_100095g16 [Nannochloropsis gaditana]